MFCLNGNTKGNISIFIEWIEKNVAATNAAIIETLYVSLTQWWSSMRKSPERNMLRNDGSLNKEGINMDKIFNGISIITGIVGGALVSVFGA